MGKASGKHSAPVWRTGNTSTVRHTGAFIIVGIALIAVAVAMVTSGVFADLTASQASAKVLAQLDEVRPEPHAATMRKRERGEDWLGREESDSMPTIVIDGYEYLGSLHIASLDLNLPVAADINDELLRRSPCRYQGSYVYSDLVICGQGYASHFGRMTSLGIRDTVRFVAADGATYDYIVSNVETDDVDELDAILHDWDLTLFTFNADGTCLVVRCVLK